MRRKSILTFVPIFFYFVFTSVYFLCFRAALDNRSNIFKYSTVTNFCVLLVQFIHIYSMANFLFGNQFNTIEFNINYCCCTSLTLASCQLFDNDENGNLIRIVFNFRLSISRKMFNEESKYCGANFRLEEYFKIFLLL